MPSGNTTAVRPRADVLERLRAALPSLTSRSRRAAEFVLEDPARAAHLSAARMALETGTSVGTVVRLCHSVGLSGVQELKLQLAEQLGAGTTAPTLPAGGPGEATFARIIDDLRVTASVFDHSRVGTLVEAIESAPRILIVSSGTSQPLAIEFGNWLNSAGRYVAYPTDTLTQDAVASQLGTEDVAFAISHSGRTPATLEPVRTAAARGATTAALTSSSASLLARIVDVAIVAGAGADGARSEDMASRMVHHAVLQVIRARLFPVVPATSAAAFTSSSLFAASSDSTCSAPSHS